MGVRGLRSYLPLTLYLSILGIRYNLKILTSIIFTGTTSGSLLLSGYFNAAMQGHMIKSAVVYSIAECGLMCLQDSNCKSFNTCSSKSELLCELNNATYDEYGEDVLSKFNCSYHSALK